MPFLIVTAWASRESWVLLITESRLDLVKHHTHGSLAVLISFLDLSHSFLVSTVLAEFKSSISDVGLVNHANALSWLVCKRT